MYASGFSFVAAREAEITEEFQEEGQNTAS